MANEKQETSADIIKEMRDLAEIDKNIGDKVPRSLMALGMETYAERLEAAHKRETVGNVAAMREALEFAEDELWAHGLFDASKRIARIASALSAPARNCDRFAFESEMRAAFIDWYNEVFDLKGSKDEIDTCDLKHNVSDILHDYIDWLFTTKKGGNDAD